MKNAVQPQKKEVAVYHRLSINYVMEQLEMVSFMTPFIVTIHQTS